MTPLQELTEANLTEREYARFTGWLALALDIQKTITRDAWTLALNKAKEARP